MVVDGRDGLVIVRPDRETTCRLPQDAARVLRPQGPPRPQPRPAGASAPTASQIELLANINNLADAQAAADGRGHGRRPVPHRVPVPHPPGRARRGGAVRVLPPDHRGLAQPDRDDPDPRPRRRQDRALPRPAERGQPVHGLAVDPPLVRAPPALRAPDPGHPPRRAARQGHHALPDDHDAGRAAARQQAGRGDPRQPPPRGGPVRRGRQDRA